MRNLWPLAKRYGFDALIVLAAGGAVVELLVQPGEARYHPTTTLWFMIPAALLTVLGLLGRRQFPFGAPAAVLLVASAVSFVEGNFAPFSFSVFLALLAAAFLLGMSRELRHALAGIPLIAAAIAVAVWNQPQAMAGDYVFVSIVFSCLWLAGFALGRKLESAHAAEQRARQREEEARRAVDEERARISRELHDVIAHSVSVMTVQAGAVRRLLEPHQQREREALEAVEETGRQALSELRRLLGVLRREGESAELAPQPGLATLAALVDQVREAGLPVELAIEGEPAQLPAGIDLSAYRIVQEALTNALNHTGPGRAWVSVHYGEEAVEVRIESDGREANGALSDHLEGMRQRALLCGGDLTAGPRTGGGFAISARLPVAT